MSFYKSNHYASNYYASDYYVGAGSTQVFRYVSTGETFVTTGDRYYSIGTSFISLADTRLYHSNEDYETLG